MLLSQYTENLLEAGCDEAGRGCLAGPVYAAAVIFHKDFKNDLLNDSKQLTKKQRDSLRPLIESESLAWAVAAVDAPTIDDINILNASFLAIHKAVGMLTRKPQLLLVDGNRFKPFPKIPHLCIIKGDGKYLSIAAASILAKTYRDDYMERLHDQHPEYDWVHNKGYPSKKHREAITQCGICDLHRKSFRLAEQLRLPF